MIPRRRIPLRGRDLAVLLNDFVESGAARRAAVERFEQAFAAYLGTRYAVATASGRDALQLILDALELASGDEVIIPAFTLGELLPLLQERGLRLIPADVDPATYNITPATIGAVLTPRTRAILAVHLLGAPCDIPGIVALADARGIAVIEDCAHGPGGTIDGRAVGTFGRAALFSLEATKPVSAYGGGIAVTDDSHLAARIRDVLGQRLAGNAARKKLLVKWAEEWAVRSPLYGPLARVLFSDRFAARFEQRYRAAHASLRTTRAAAPQAFSSLQAHLASDRLAALDDRNRRLNARWNELAARLPHRFHPQQRERMGQPAFYNFVARFVGDVRALRQAALRKGLDLGIGSEVMDDVARMLGNPHCPNAGALADSVVQIPLYDGMGRRRFERMIHTLHKLAREVP